MAETPHSVQTSAADAGLVALRARTPAVIAPGHVAEAIQLRRGLPGVTAG